jgi:hypothetical protein
MFESHQKSTGTGYTTTVALLAVALVFSPAALFFIRPFSYLSLGLAASCSVVCLGLAGVSWKRLSQLSIPSLVTQEEKSK